METSHWCGEDKNSTIRKHHIKLDNENVVQHHRHIGIGRSKRPKYKDTVHHNVLFLHDGAPAHFSTMLPNYLHATYTSGLPGPHTLGFHLLEPSEISCV
ncbi:hypothetical protein TNCV_2410331 [Trichonephila clavipes]|nr:hypothetical protein TNCV_2410331 [Trichonephila clavipes]